MILNLKIYNKTVIDYKVCKINGANSLEYLKMKLIT